MRIEWDLVIAVGTRGRRRSRCALDLPPLALLNSGPPDGLFQFDTSSTLTTSTEVVHSGDRTWLRRILVAGVYTTQMVLVCVGDGWLPGIKEQSGGKGE